MATLQSPKLRLRVQVLLLLPHEEHGKSPCSFFMFFGIVFSRNGAFTLFYMEKLLIRFFVGELSADDSEWKQLLLKEKYDFRRQIRQHENC